MSGIRIESNFSPNVTMIPNWFIDQYMPKANGEFVKIYLYLARLLSQPDGDFQLASAADTLYCTERDILRALKYWEQEGLAVLTYGEDKKLCRISLTALTGVSEPSPKPAAAQTPAPASAEPQPKKESTLTPDRVKELKENEDIIQLLFIAEQYLGKTLTPTDTNRILYFYEDLKLPADLIEYLIEYCVSKGNRSMHYIEAVALSWAQKGISTVKMAKEESHSYNKKYFTILKALGIRNRNPVHTEISIMDTWINDYGFTLDLICEACTRTVLQTGQASFQYADTILKDWKKRKIHHISQLSALDAEFKKNQKKGTAKETTSRKGSSTNRFNNFHQRDYDYEELEKRLSNK